MAQRARLFSSEPAPSRKLADGIKAAARSLHGWEDLDPLIERIGDAHFVLLGEASHGTSEYYQWRRLISQRLIREKGFSFIAVEGDWPDCYRINRYVKGYANAGRNARDVLSAFARWPTWMWANEEMIALSDWLREHNASLPDVRKVGFYGLDVYSLWESMQAVLEYLQKRDGAALAAARKAFECFEPYAYDEQEYARATLWVPTSCEEEVVRLLQQLRTQGLRFDQDKREAFFNAEQNALVMQNAEKYYRTLVRGDAESWNVRDRHMVETLNRLLSHHGPKPKAIIWEHKYAHRRCTLHRYGG